MVNKLSLLLLAVLLGFQANAQIPIVKDSVLVKGFYKDFKEFKNNNPSINIDYEIESKEVNCGSSDSSESFDKFTVLVSSKNAVQVEKVWGFCDGERIYINIAHKDLRKKSKFAELTIRNNMAFYMKNCKTGGYVINLKTGARYVEVNESSW